MKKNQKEIRIEQILNTPYISNKQYYKKKSLFENFIYYSDDLTEEQKLESITKLMKNQRIKDLNTLKYTDSKNLLMLSNGKYTVFLIKNKLIDYNDTDCFGNSFFVYTSLKSIKNILKLNIDINWNHRNNNGDNILNFMVKNLNFYSPEKIKFFINLGVDVNNKNNDGQNVIDNVISAHYYDNTKKYNIIKDLILAGADYKQIKYKEYLKEEWFNSIFKEKTKQEVKFLRNNIKAQVYKNNKNNKRL